MPYDVMYVSNVCLSVHTYDGVRPDKYIQYSTGIRSADITFNELSRNLLPCMETKWMPLQVENGDRMKGGTHLVKQVVFNHMIRR